jgi:hypothetical protein
MTTQLMEVNHNPNKLDVCRPILSSCILKSCDIPTASNDTLNGDILVSHLNPKSLSAINFVHRHNNFFLDVFDRFESLFLLS